jgi:hypothetical protein
MNQIQEAGVEVLHGSPKTAARPPASTPAASEIPKVAETPTQGPNCLNSTINCRSTADGLSLAAFFDNNVNPLYRQASGAVSRDRGVA